MIIFFFFGLSSLVTETHIEYGDVSCPEFELWPLCILCNVSINWIKLTLTWLIHFYYIYFWIIKQIN